MRPFLPMLAALAGLGAIASIASGQTPIIDNARGAGVVGERYDGYLGYVTSPGAMLRSQVETINIRRRSLYSNLAASKGVTPQDVGVTAGCQLLARVTVGQAYLLSDGSWRRRLAGQRAPVPDYCG